jgi:hypothetical protein
MTPASRRLAALAAALAPDRCASLAERLGPSLREAAIEAVRLARLPRAERLRSLAQALAADAAPGSAAVGARAPLHPLLERLAREATASRRAR